MARRYELATRINPDTEEREWGLTIQDYSRVRDAVANAAFAVCALTKHRAEGLFVPVYDWAWSKERRIILVPITEDDAFLVDPAWVTLVKRHERAWEDDDDDE